MLYGDFISVEQTFSAIDLARLTVQMRRFQ